MVYWSRGEKSSPVKLQTFQSSCCFGAPHQWCHVTLQPITELRGHALYMQAETTEPSNWQQGPLTDSDIIGWEHWSTNDTALEQKWLHSWVKAFFFLTLLTSSPFFKYNGCTVAPLLFFVGVPTYLLCKQSCIYRGCSCSNCPQAVVCKGPNGPSAT